MLRIPGGLVYEPADLGLDNVSLPPAGVLVDGLIVPWRAAFPIRAVAWTVQLVSGGATPFNLLGQQFTILSAALAARGTFHQNFTNNPLPATGYVNGATPTAGVVVTGAILAGELSRLFQAPYYRFTLVNSHATITATAAFLTVTVYE